MAFEKNYCVPMKIFTLLVVPFLLVSCDIVNPEEEIPGYIRVDSVSLDCESGIQGEPTQNVTDVWVNVDGSRQGTYEMPVTFPVLATGTHALVFRAGIRNNGIAASRKIYPFFDFYEIDYKLTADSIHSINPVFHYRDETVFAWLENFEDAGISLKRNAVSDTTLVVVPDGAANNNSGYFAIDDLNFRFLYESSDTILRPASGSEVYLELEYRNDEPLIVGLKLIKPQSTSYESIITLNPKPATNKIYIDLGQYLTTATDVYFFGVYFFAQKQSTAAKSEFYIDNIKLLHF